MQSQVQARKEQHTNSDLARLKGMLCVLAVIACVFTAVLLGALFGQLEAQEPEAQAASAALDLDAETLAELEAITQEISDTTMSPFCPGRTLSACPSDQARQLRVRIMGWLKQGYTPQGVRNQLLTIYGGDVRGTPKAEGFGLMAWIMPSVFVLFCLLLVALVLRKSKQAEVKVPEEPESLSDEMKNRISEELENRR